MSLGKAEFEQNPLPLKEIWLKASIIGNTSQPLIQTYTDGPTLIYHEDDTRAVTLLDAAPGFALTDLDNDAPPAVLGFVIPVANALEIVEISVPLTGIVNVALSAPMTAGVVTLRGASSSGVTASANISFTLSCTGLDIDEDVAITPNCTFWVLIKYRSTQPRSMA